MNSWYRQATLTLIWTLATAAVGQESSPSDQPDEPFLQVKAGGPQSYITALEFSPDGNKLYAAGWDKVVHVWKRDPASGSFSLQSDLTYRIPIGPGLRGAINAMAVSGDGNWLAVAGHGIMRGGGTFRRPGRVLPSEGILTQEMRLDEGVIHVFNTRTRVVHPVRGHAGAVVSLAFAPGDAASPVLVSAAREWIEQDGAPARYRGTVRVWDVLKKENAGGYIGGRYLSEPLSRPGLAVQRIGQPLNRLQVGIAWGDEQFRVWDVASNELQATASGRYSNTVAATGANRWLTGGFERTGLIRSRSPIDESGRQPLEAAPGDFLIPRSLAATNQPAGRAAIVSRVVRQNDAAQDGHFVLHLSPLENGSPTNPAGPSRLWQVPNTGAIPAVAVAAASQLVAVAGDSDQSIWVYSWQGVANRQDPQQILRNAGSSWQHVNFVQKADHSGLRLRGGSSELIFDLEEQIGVADPEGWNNQPSASERFSVAIRQTEEATELLARENGGELSRIALAAKEVISTYAIAQVPEDKPLGGRPILALATHQLGQPTLRLYDLAAGVPFRQLTGHSQTIESIAFSADAGLLATVAGDQTICLWDLSDVDTVLDEHGMLAGVAVGREPPASQQQGAVVNSIETKETESWRQAVQTGDILFGATVGEQKVTFSGGREFFDAFWAMKPGSAVQLLVRSRGGDREIAARVGQAIDERKPLLSLFVTTAAAGGPREWIAWTPIGPYEASGREAERFLGWHFNTPEPAAPVRYAAAAQYRDVYYRAGLVKELVGQGELIQPPPPPAPAVSIRFDQDALPTRGSDGGLVVRQVPPSVHVFVSDFPNALVESVAVTVQGERFANTNRLHDDEWSVELFGFDWPRGSQRFRTVVRTNERPPREFVSETSVTRIPLPPQIASELPSRQTVESESFQLSARVTAAAASTATTRVLLNGSEVNQSTAAEVREQLTLRPGNNEIELVATNEGATADSRRVETARTIFRVTYQKAPALPPEIVVQRLESVEPSQSTKFGVDLPADGRPGIVEHPQLQVAGLIRSAEPLSQATFRTSRQDEPAQLEVERKLGTDEWHFQLPWSLAPGDQELQIAARAADSDEATARVPIRFVPPLPKIVLQAGQRGLIQRDAGQPAAVVDFAGRFEASESTFPFQARVLRNDELLEDAEVDVADNRWTVSVPLRGGENQLRLLVTNEWGRTTTSETRTLEYQRLPRIVSVAHSDVGREPFTDITVRVACPPDRPLTDVSLNDRHLSAANWEQVANAADGVLTFEAKFAGYPLQPGQNSIRLLASNADGRCREAQVIDVAYDAAVWEPARITFLNAAPSTSVVEPSYELEFRVESPSPLRRVGVELDRRPVPDDQIVRSESPAHTDFRVLVPLREGVNQLVVRAQNAGGEAEGKRQISFVPPPVRVAVTSLTPLAARAEAIRPSLGADRQLLFSEPIALGYARLKGVVQWNRAATAGRAESAELRVWVNGFQQPPIKVDASQAEQPFETLIVLGEPQRNRIVLDLVGAASDTSSRLEFSVDCLDPRGGQRLHLLTIGIDKQDPKLLQDRALGAVGAEVDSDGSFRRPYRAPGFDRINIYPPLNGRVTFSDIFRLLLDVRSDLLVPTGVGPSGEPIPVNDVVMLYYEGGILVAEQEHFVLSTSEEYDPGVRFSAISSEWLAKFFDSMRGAQLAFIDVAARTQRTEVPVADWNHDSHAALLCYAWSDGSAPPSELRLINAVRKALASVNRLGELDGILADLSAESSELNYHRALPDELKTIVLRRP